MSRKLEREETEKPSWAQIYFNRRPKLKKRVLELLKAGATNKEIFEVVGANIQKPLAQLRKETGYKSDWFTRKKSSDNQNS